MFKNIKNKKALVFLVFILIVIPASVIVATEGFTMQADWPTSPMSGIDLSNPNHQNITHFIAYIYEWGIALGGLVAFIALLIAGFHYLTSVGDPGKMKEATDRIKSAFLGLTLLLGSWLILHTINPELTRIQPIDFELVNAPQIELPALKGRLQQKHCSKAIMFESTNFEGRTFTRYAGEGAKNIRNWRPQSFVMCRELKEGETPPQDDICQREGYVHLVEGGACVLQLFEGKKGWFWGCSEPMIPLYGPRNSDIGLLIPIEDIRCLELNKI